MKKKPKICTVRVNGKDMVGKVLSEYEELGGPEDGAKFYIIELDNGQTITVKLSDMECNDIYE